MPYEWLPPRDGETRLHLWPYRSLPRRGFVWFIGGTAALLLLPLIAVLGSPVLWGLLPFLLGAVGAIWWALNRSSDRACPDTGAGLQRRPENAPERR